MPYFHYKVQVDPLVYLSIKQKRIGCFIPFDSQIPSVDDPEILLEHVKIGDSITFVYNEDVVNELPAHLKRHYTGSLEKFVERIERDGKKLRAIYFKKDRE